MADLYINLLEKITLGDVDRSVNTIQTISNISYIDNRIFQLPSGSVTTIFSLSNINGAGTFVTSSLKYARITNQSAALPIKLIVSSSTEAMSYLVSAGSSYMLSTSEMTGSATSLTFDDIVSVKAEPSGGAANIEYFIATT